MAKLEGAQLAEQYHGEPLPYPHLLEPKLDGLRGIALISDDEIRFVSRNGKPYHNTEAVANNIRDLGLTGEWVLDGELFVDDWNTTAHTVRSEKRVIEYDRLMFIIFDIMEREDWDAGRSKSTLQQRWDALVYLIGTDEFSNIRLSPHRMVSTPEEVYVAAREFVARGYEGAMLKDPRAIYQRRRWSAWRKVKFANDYDVVVVGVQPGEGRHKGRLGAIVFEHNGIRSEVGTGLTDTQRDELWTLYQQGGLVGKTIEITSQEITGGGHHRFPVFVRLREDK